jgi:predicted transcriptional regulator
MPEFRMEQSGLIEILKSGDSSYLVTKKGKRYLMEFKKLEEFGIIFGVEI